MQRRVADNFNLVPLVPKQLGSAERQTRLVAAARIPRENCDQGLGILPKSSHSDEMPGNDSMPSAVLEEEDPSIDDCGVEDVSAPELLAASLLLTRVLAEKAGAATCERFLRVVLHKNFGKAAALIREQCLDTVPKITDELDIQVADDMKHRGYRPVWIENPDNNTDGAIMYLHDRLEVIKRQLEKPKSTEKNFYFQPYRDQNMVTKKPVRRHPMSADIARDCTTAKVVVMRLKDWCCVWSLWPVDNNDMTTRCVFLLLSAGSDCWGCQATRLPPFITSSACK